MNFSSAALRESTAESPAPGGNPASGTTWISPNTGRDFPAIFNQPVEVAHPHRRKADK